MRDIEVCRTEQLGGHLDLCNHCGFRRPAYNSCRNRHCPDHDLDSENWRAFFLRLTGIDLDRCPRCGLGLMCIELPRNVSTILGHECGQFSVAPPC